MTDISYLMHIRQNSCLRCDNKWTESNLYCVEIRGTERRIFAETSMLPDKTLGISRLQPRNVETCFLCAEFVVAERLKSQLEAEERWAETLKRKAAEEPQRPNGTPTMPIKGPVVYNSEGFRVHIKPPSTFAKKAAGIPTLDDL